jgi:hypothetical protein
MRRLGSWSATWIQADYFRSIGAIGNDPAD